MDWNKYRLVLASSSTSRKLLFEQVKIPFTIRVSGVDETVPKDFSPRQVVTALAKRKATAVFAGENEIVVGADSVVSIDNQILGKPKDYEHAKEMLRLLSGRTHEIFTGVCIRYKEQEEVFAQMTEVTFYPLTTEEIEEYVATGEPFGKAGSYGIESRGVQLIQSIHGDYANVVGIPIAETLRKIKKLTNS